MVEQKSAKHEDGKGVPPSADQKTVTFVLPPDLSDGNYRFRIPTGAIARAGGGATTANSDIQGPGVFIFAGDADRDRSINISDFATLAANFNTTGIYSQGDFNYSGTIEIGDFSILASKFNTTLVFARPSTARLGFTAAASFGRTPIERGDDDLLEILGLRS